MKLTPFEQAEKNRVMHNKRMQMTLKVTELITRLQEAEDFLAVAEAQQQDYSPVDYGMYDPAIIETVRKEVQTITATLVVMANVWEEVTGVSA